MGEGGGVREVGLGVSEGGGVMEEGLRVKKGVRRR